MKHFLMIFISILNIFIIGATDQYKDLLVINNDIIEINSPIDLISDSSFNNTWYNKIIKNDINSSACWRGAICTWMIKNDSLFLIKAESCIDRTQLDLSLLDNKHNKIFAKWINGLIEYSSGRSLCTNIFEIDKMFDGCNNVIIFEFDNVISVNNGIAKIQCFDNRLSRCGRFIILPKIRTTG